MGVERTATALQNKQNVYEIDEFKSIMEKINYLDVHSKFINETIYDFKLEDLKRFLCSVAIESSSRSTTLLADRQSLIIQTLINAEIAKQQGERSKWALRLSITIAFLAAASSAIQVIRSIYFVS